MKDLFKALQEDLPEFTHEQEFEVPWRPPTAVQPVEAAELPGGTVPNAKERTPGSCSGQALELHPNARANFDAKAEPLLSMLVASPAVSETDARVAARTPSKQVVAPLPPHAVPAETTLFRNLEGTTAARTFVHGGMIMGLQGEGYRALRRIAEAMQRTQTLRALVGVDTREKLMRDYEARTGMVFGDAPTFADVIASVAAIQERVNERSS